MSRYAVRPLLLSAIAAGLLLQAGCTESAKPTSPPPVVVKGVTVATVRNASLPETIEVVGTVRARTSALVLARIPGTVCELHVREGDRVRKGQLLARLDSQESTAQATAALAAIDEARRGLDEARAQRTLAEATFTRFKALYDEQALTRQEFETRQTERDLARQAVARAEARLRQVQETARAAGTMADYSRIVAPVSGLIASKQVDLGATVFPGQPLMTIDDESTYQLELAVPESYAVRIHPGSPVQITLDALQKSINAKVTELVPAADPGSRTFTAKVPLGVRGVASGMFGRGSISLGGTIQTILVPKQAVFERGALTAVWAVDRDATARMRLVKVGTQVGNQVEILSGLSAGERIVTQDTGRVSDGARVEP